MDRQAMTTALLTIDVQQAIDSPLSRSFNLHENVGDEATAACLFR